MHDARITTGELGSALAIGSVALLVIGLQPILLGELLEAHQVTLEGVGLVAMAEIVALGIGVLLGDLTLSPGRIRVIAIVSSLLAMAMDALTLSAAGDQSFVLVRAGAGLAEGVLVWVTTAVIVRSRNPERVAGLYFVLQTAAQAILGLVLARVVIPAYGWHGAFALVAGVTLLCAILSMPLPRNLQPLAPSAQSGFRWSIHTAIPLVVVFLQLASLGSLWAYVEPLGKSAGYGSSAVQTLIAAALVMQIVGGCVGSALVRRLATVPTLATGSAVLGAVALMMLYTLEGATVPFAALCAVFAFTWLFIMPYQMGLAFGADGSGRLASLIPAAQLFGIAAGPLAASLTVHGENAAPVPWVSASFAAAAAVALLLGTYRRHPAAIRI